MLVLGAEGVGERLGKVGEPVILIKDDAVCEQLAKEMGLQGNLNDARNSGKQFVVLITTHQDHDVFLVINQGHEDREKNGLVIMAQRFGHSYAMHRFLAIYLEELMDTVTGPGGEKNKFEIKQVVKR